MIGRRGGGAPPLQMAVCGDPAIAVSHNNQIARAQVVDEDKRLASDYGCKGTNSFMAALPYMHANNLFRLPMCHAGLLGAVKHFLRVLLPKDAKSLAGKSDQASCQLRVDVLLTSTLA